MDNTVNEENIKLKLEIIKYKEAMEEIYECIDSFYDEGTPRCIYPELEKFAGYIQVIHKVAKNRLDR